MATPYRAWIILLDQNNQPTKLEEGDFLWFDGKDSTIHATRGDTDLRFHWSDTSNQASRVANSFGARGLGSCALEFILRLIAGCAGFGLEATTALSRRESGFRCVKLP